MRSEQYSVNSKRAMLDLNGIKLTERAKEHVWQKEGAVTDSKSSRPVRKQRPIHYSKLTIILMLSLCCHAPTNYREYCVTGNEVRKWLQNVFNFPHLNIVSGISENKY